MIIANNKDKFVKTICASVLESELYQKLPPGKDLYVYGVSEDRSCSVALSGEAFPDAYSTVNFFANLGYSAHNACFWELGQSYNYQVLGLGFGLRKNKKEDCKKIILLTYMALNGLIDFKKETE